MAKHLYVFDFDGTIAKSKYPRPHTPINLADALKIMDPLRVSLDEPRQSVIQWMQHIRLYAGSDSHVMILTGRPEASRQLTEAWCQLHGVPYEALVMLGEPTCAPTATKKREYLAKVQAEWDSVLVVDDDPAVGTVCAELGIGYVNATDL